MVNKEGTTYSELIDGVAVRIRPYSRTYFKDTYQAEGTRFMFNMPANEFDEAGRIEIIDFEKFLRFIREEALINPPERQDGQHNTAELIFKETAEPTERVLTFFSPDLGFKLNAYVVEGWIVRITVYNYTGFLHYFETFKETARIIDRVEEYEPQVRAQFGFD